MKLTIVGCAGSYPTPESPGSCYLIEHDGQHLVLDMGPGSVGSLQNYLDPVLDDSFLGVALSHCHIDHCVDVGSLYVMRHYGPVRPSHRLIVLGPEEAPERLAGISGRFDASGFAEDFDIRAYEPVPMHIGPFELTVSHAIHPVEAYSMRVTAGDRSITFSGDTGPTPTLPALAAGTDIALFEASMSGSANPGDVHLTGADAGRAAEEADAGLLILTHMVTWTDNEAVLREAARAFSGPIERAHVGMTVTL